MVVLIGFMMFIMYKVNVRQALKNAHPDQPFDKTF